VRFPDFENDEICKECHYHGKDAAMAAKQKNDNPFHFTVNIDGVDHAWMVKERAVLRSEGNICFACEYFGKLAKKAAEGESNENI